MNDDLTELATELGRLLLARGRMLATAESCTGGWIAKCCTDVAGSSAWFERGFVTYSNQSKQEMLGVPVEMLEREGAVSEAVVCAMAEGALRYSQARQSVAVSGIAGPGGGGADKPVGTVWLAWAVKEGVVRTQRVEFAGDREAVRRQTVSLALRGLMDEYE